MSALDLAFVPPLEIEEGIWCLQYTNFATGFPLLSVESELDVTDFKDPRARLLAHQTT
jgi:hypothetical protein